MNETTVAIFGVSFIVFVTICFLAGFLGNSFKPISDEFDIGYIKPVTKNQTVESKTKTIYIDKPKIIYRDRIIKDTIEISKLKNEIAILNSKISKLKSEQIVVRTQEQKEHPLYRDCVDAAVALGCKKREAEKGVREFFATNNVDSIEEFIVKYFKKG